jgi:hypothetical protein
MDSLLDIKQKNCAQCVQIAPGATVRLAADIAPSARWWGIEKRSAPAGPGGVYVSRRICRYSRGRSSGSIDDGRSRDAK